DIAMTDNMFMLMTWAMGQGLVTGKWPGNGDALLTGGSPRYRLYPTRDGRFVAVAALEQKFWDRVCDLIGLPDDLRDDGADPQATIAAVATIIASKTAGEWRRTFYHQDCCCSIVQSLEEAMQEPHFRSRGLFDHVLENEDGERIPATPVCVVPQFRSPPEKPKSAPALGAHNDETLKRAAG